ncbi:MAG TPA: hypothetical protein ENJ28_00135 [Gammaproteobacteria bacterium]|nr:hypothetical protein [Gammaproteobacteria bacterium]
MSINEANIVTGESAKSSAKLFSYGNIVAVLIPLPMLIFWFGASIVFYATQRHHPNPRVGYYTQIAAYQYYALAGLLVPVLTFAPEGFFKNYWLIMWIICIVLIVPLAIMQLIKINREEWKDVTIEKQQH